MPRGAAERDRLEGPQQAARAQYILQLQHLVFFSYSWPRLHVLRPPAISQGPDAKTVNIGCCGVQHSSRPASHSALTPFTGRGHMSVHTVREKQMATATKAHLIL